MNKTMDNLFVRAGRALRVHFDDSRITAAAIRQLSWRVEQGGGAIVGQPSSADVLVVDPAAPWVFHDFLRTKRPELRPSVVLAFWIPLCLTTRSLVWINHSYWQQVVIPSERPPHSEVPQGITAYSSFLAGISYSKNSLLSSTKFAPRSSTALARDSSVISNLDNSDLEVSRSLEPGASSDDEPLEIPRKPKEATSRKTRPRSDSPSTSIAPQRSAEVQRDEAEVSDILPAEVSLPPHDVDMSPPSSPPERVQQLQEESIVENVAAPSRSTPTGSTERRPLAVSGPSISQRHSPLHRSPPQDGQDSSQSRGDVSPASVTVAAEPVKSSTSNGAQAATETGRSTAPQHSETESASLVVSETVAGAKEAYVPPTLDSTPSPVQEEPNSTTVILDNSRPSSPLSPSASIIPSTARSEPANGSNPSNAPDGQPTTQGKAAAEINVTRKPAEPTGSTVAPTETASTSTAPPNTPTTVPKASAQAFPEGHKPTVEGLSGTPSSKPSPSNATKVRVRPKMRPPPERSDSASSSPTPKTDPLQPKSKLKIQSNANGQSTRPSPSAVVSMTGGTPLVKSTTSALAHSPASTISSSVTNRTTSIPASVNTTPATTVAADTPNPGAGSSLSRPKQLIVRSPTISATALRGPSASVSPVQTRHRNTSSSAYYSSPEILPLFSPPTPPTPTPEQLAAKRPVWTKEEDQYIIDYMNWVFAQDPLASTSEIMKEVAAHCPYRSVANWQNRFTSKEDSIYMNEVPVLFERLTNKTSGGSSSRNASKTLGILSGSRTRNRSAVDYVDSSDDENGATSNDGEGPPRKRTRRSRASGRRRSERMT
ncbi:Sialidase [Rhizoctonia solani]|uniref:Sialidase n=1 Tax=Rhizoctonia solani TaxID=456999 RepID=A0A0K6GFX9_9AGAM|nr:Sialidase [Rhizoctonia solani]